MGFGIGLSNRRTLKHGKIDIVAERPGKVHVGTTEYTSAAARELANQTPPGPGSAELIRKLREQANWADGKDM